MVIPALGAALLVGLLPAQSLAMPPDPANVEIGREGSDGTDPLDLEAIEPDKPFEGEVTGNELETLKVDIPTDLQQAPAGTTTAPSPDTDSFTFGSAVSPASVTTSATTEITGNPLSPISDLPILAGQATGHPAPTGTWQFSVADRSRETGKGIQDTLKVGALVTVQAPATGSVPISVGIKYGAFENLHGADWASRLRLVQFPECYLTTPDVEACQEYEELETVNDPVSRTLKATVDTAADGTTTPALATATAPSGPAIMQASYTTATPAATGGDTAVLGAVDSGSGPRGSFKATSLPSSGKWAAGGPSGAFTWTYPMVLPPTPAGPMPNVTLSYNSQTVDGKTSVSSPQASWIGEGWDYSPGFIERRYRNCKNDAHNFNLGTPNNTGKADKTGDLCWASYNAVMSLGGSTTELVRVATTTPETGTETYRPQQDDGTLVHHHTRTAAGSSANGDNNGEYWTVTKADGTKYHFGLNKVGGTHADTNSVSTVPVFGNHDGEPCHAPTFASSRCGADNKQAWRWGLDKVEDVHGNVMIVNWKQETNYYAVRGKRATPERYDRAAHPTSIEYGIRATDLNTPSATIEFGVQQRCTKSTAACAEANFAKTNDPGAYRPWWDTPGALNCKNDSDLCPGFPSFWSQIRLETVTTKTARYVDRYTLHHSFPEDWYDTSPGLWLNSITRTGYGTGDTPTNGGGTPQSKDGVSFAPYVVGSRAPQHLKAYLNDQHLPNLVTNDHKPTFTRPRIGVVRTETGGEIEVQYTGGCRNQSTTTWTVKDNALCYQLPWSPDDEAETPPKFWFNKYVVASVTETDLVTQGLFTKPTRTEYTYTGPAWAQSDDEFLRPKLRTASDWRGFREVAVAKGAKYGTAATQTQTYSKTRYFQGTGGAVVDSIDQTPLLPADEGDAPQYAGMTAETLTYLNSSKPHHEFTSRTRTFPAKATKTAERPRANEDGTPLAALRAYRTTVMKTDSIQKVGDTWRGVRTTTEHDENGLPIEVERWVVTPGSPGSGESLSEPSCTTTSYVDNPAAGLIGLPKTVRSTATTCLKNPTADPATELKSSVEIQYDNISSEATAKPTKGLVTSLSEIDGTGTTHSVTTNTTYDDLGRILKITKPGADAAAPRITTETQYTPPGGGPVTSTTTTNAKGHATTTAFEPGRGLPITVTDPNLRVTRNQYDDLGRLTSAWSASRSAGTQTPSVKFTYQNAAAVPGELATPSAVTAETLKDDGTYSRQVTIYDGFMRQVQTQSEAHGPGRIISDTHYNDHGLVNEQSSSYLAKNEPSTELFTVTSTSRVPSATTTAYDGLERPLKQTVTYGKTGRTPTTRTTTYNTDTTVTVDPAGSTVPATTTVTDALGRVTEIRHHTGSGKYRTTTYGYDKRGNRNKVTDPAGNAWTYIHDARGRVTSVKDPDTGTTKTEYDDADRPKSVIDALDKSTYTTYDVLGRITAVREGSATGTPTKSFKYDTNDDEEKNEVGWIGLQAQATRHTTNGDYITKVTGYDTEYRPTGRQVVIPTSSMTTSLSGTYSYNYSYTLTGRPLSVTLPAKGGLAAEKVITRYNEDGLPETTSGTDWYTSDVTYSPYGEALRIVSSAQPYRVWTTNFIDEHTGRTQRTVTDRETAGPHRISDTGYAYDDSGMITASARQNAETPTVTNWDNQCFTYDAMGELVNAWTSNIKPDGKGTGCKSASGATWGHRTDAAPSTGPVADAAHQAGATPAGLGNTAPATGTVATGTAVTGAAAYRQSFTYDWIGNRATLTEHDPAGDTTKNTIYTYTYSATQPHVLISATSPTPGTSSTYTPNPTGTTKTRTILGGTQTQNLQWTTEQKLESNTIGNDKITYVYDAAGNRILEHSPTGSTLYLGETELTTNGTAITRASRSYGQAGAPTVVRTTNGSSTGHGLTVLIADHLGTANTAVELSGTGTQAQAVTRRAFKPYGELRGTKPGTWPNKRSYLGVGIDDTTTGLTHIGAREYDQHTGRFLSVDPLIDITDPLQMNGYTYANGSPVSKSDPTGLRPEGICGGNSSTCRPDNHPNEMSVTYHETWQPKGNGWKYSAYEERNGKIWHTQFGGVNFGTVIDLKPRGLTLNKNTLPGMGRALASYVSTPAISLLTGGYSPTTALYDTTMEKFGVDTKDPGYEDGEMLVDMAGLVFAGAGAAKSIKGFCHSFLPGTEVLMADGSHKKIEEVEAGDVVVTTDVATGKNAEKKVLETIRTEDDKDFTEITIATGGGLSSIVATDTHPFWVPALEEWVPAGNLQIGQWLRTSAGTLVQITALDHYSKRQRTHDLTIEDIHAYYVLAGATPVLVHNCNRGGLDFTDAERQKVYDANAAKNGGEYRCDYCGQKVERRGSRDADGNPVPGRPDDAQIDHIEPRAGGGHGGAHNGAVACRRCNRDKSTKTMEDWDDELRDFLEP
ncbi:polymorphic toxin-type HINT domain-containing protein [Streptomyces sp. NPDC057193]|uniref:polymorphic toxin-type HINT domain-containing protein n=1 Tax=Streptomyces sp. NPDC057193 TaxID=3346043 RepID=UPI0036445B6C